MAVKEQIRNVNTFHQTASNYAKFGAYYTNNDMMYRCGRVLNIPNDEGKVTVVLEPHIGDASAVTSLLRGAGAERKSIVTYGVDINADTIAKLKENKISNHESDEEGKVWVDYLLNADTTHGIIMSNAKVDLCYDNPPYGEADGTRLEQIAEETTFKYLKRNGVHVFVVPYYLISDMSDKKYEKFAKSFFGRYQPIRIFRFDDDVYKDFKQIVIISRRRDCIGFMIDDFKAWIESVNELEKLPYLPKVDEEFDERWRVLVSNGADGVDKFTTKAFLPEEALPALKMSKILCRGISDLACIEEYTSDIVGNPPIPPADATKYELMVCGVCEGLAGDEDEGTLHLQRGYVEQVETSRIKDNGSGKEDTIEVTLSSETSIHIFDSEFNYIVLKAGAANTDTEDIEDDEED